MLQAGFDANFAEEALGPDRRGHLGRKHLDGYFAAMLRVIGQIYPGHASAADFPIDRVPIRERRAKDSNRSVSTTHTGPCPGSCVCYRLDNR